MPPSHNPHDHFFKQTLGQPGLAAEFFRLYLPTTLVACLDTSHVTVVKDSFVDEELQEHFSDALFRVKLKNGAEAYIYVLLEHKSAPDDWVSLQILRYLVHFWEQARQQKPKKLPLVLPVVFYHGAQRWRTADNFLSLFEVSPELAVLRDYLPEFRYHLCDLSRYRDEDLPPDGLLASALLLLKHIFRRSLKKLLPEAIRRGLGRNPIAPGDAEYIRTALIYLLQTNKVSEREFLTAFRQVIQEKGIPMTENFIDRWINQGRTQGMQQGVQQGMQQGVQQGVQQGEVNIVMRLLKRRLGELPASAETRIQNLPIASLEQLSEALLDFQETGDLTAWLKKHPPADTRETERLM